MAQPLSRATCAFVLAIILSAAAPTANAGGPRYVAGASYFDPAVKGAPLTWAQGNVQYYTDQGDLSPILPGPTADTFVADAFNRWTLIATAALSTNRLGQLSEDVSGANVTVDAEGNLTMPLDIQPAATDKPVAVVYDADGAVTDALLGSGSSSLCFSNAVFGAVDNFSADGHLVHALVVINGSCAQTSAQLPDVQYRLMRVLGHILGLDWSQLNKNAQTGTPHPTSDDYAGLPVMHQIDLYECVPISLCYPNADQPKMDDAAAISRLYPVTSENLASFSGKQLFAASTGRIHGSVHFVDAAGQPAQPMQGVNVVARWIDPATNKPSHRYSASSVSGFLFRGNAGNPVTGFSDSTGQPWDRFGSDDPQLEGSFDLAGLQFPDGRTTAQYEISVEAIDPDWSQGVGPYGPWQVKPSGSAQPILVTVSKGGEVQQDIVMTGSVREAGDSREPSSWDAPAVVPAAGDWMASLSGYGDVDYYRFPGHTNRTLSVEVLALDEANAASQDKARPVVGMWSLATPAGAAPGAATPTAFISLNYGLSRLDAVLLDTTDFRIGIADERGDGRPDYRYRARVLYGHEVIPARVSAGGGRVVGIRGMGFQPGMTVSIGKNNPIGMTPFSVVSNLVIAPVPAMADGVQNITLADAATGGSSILTDAITYGAGPDDSIVLLSGANPPTPAGSETANPVRVRVLAPDGSTPVAGASVNFSASPSAALSACGGATSCTVLTDENGEASTRVTPPTTGVFIITAALAPASYSPAKYVQATVSSMSSALDISIVSPYRWIAENTSLDLLLSARVLSNGSPLNGKTVSFQVVDGSAAVNPVSTSTDSNGYANTIVELRNFAAEVRISACVSPTAAPCAILYLTKVPLSSLQLHTVAGSGQIVAVGQPFQPVIVEVTDSSSPANPVQGAPVNFWQVVFRSDNDAFSEVAGEIGSNYAMPVMLSSSQNTAVSDALGLASMVPSAAGVAGPVEIEIMASTGTQAVQQFEVESMWTGVGVAQGSGPRSIPENDSELQNRGASRRRPGTAAARLR